MPPAGRNHPNRGRPGQGGELSSLPRGEAKAGRFCCLPVGRYAGAAAQRGQGPAAGPLPGEARQRAGGRSPPAAPAPPDLAARCPRREDAVGGRRQGAKRPESAGPGAYAPGPALLFGRPGGPQGRLACQTPPPPPKKAGKSPAPRSMGGGVIGWEKGASKGWRSPGQSPGPWPTGAPVK